MADKIHIPTAIKSGVDTSYSQRLVGMAHGRPKGAEAAHPPHNERIYGWQKDFGCLKHIHIILVVRQGKNSIKINIKFNIALRICAVAYRKILRYNYLLYRSVQER